jgi:hypothetical protein
VCNGPPCLSVQPASARGQLLAHLAERLALRGVAVLSEWEEHVLTGMQVRHGLLTGPWVWATRPGQMGSLEVMAVDVLLLCSAVVRRFLIAPQ